MLECVLIVHRSTRLSYQRGRISGGNV